MMLALNPNHTIQTKRETLISTYVLGHCAPKSFEQRIETARKLGAPQGSVCVVIPPNVEGGKGFQTVQQSNFKEPVYADGAIIGSQRSALTISSRDCPILVLMNTHTGKVSVTHVGRAAVTPPKGCSCCSFTVINPALKNILTDETRTTDIVGYISPGICASHFCHNSPDARRFIEPFLQYYGPEVFCNVERGELDLIKIIYRQLTKLGVPKENIIKDDRCTVSDKTLSSKRGFEAGKKCCHGHNEVYVVIQ